VSPQPPTLSDTEAAAVLAVLPALGGAGVVVIQSPAVWGPAAIVQERYGIGKDKLRALWQAGHVRRAKLGKERNCAAVYFLADIDLALKCLAEGRTPPTPSLPRRTVKRTRDHGERRLTDE